MRRRKKENFSLSNQVKRYLEWLEVRGYSQATIRTQRQNIRLFLIWCEERGVTQVRELDRSLIEHYQRHLVRKRKQNGQPLSMRTQHQRLVTIRGLGKWLAKKRVLLYNPAAELELPKLGQALPQTVLTADEAETVLNVPDIDKSLGLRDRAILEVLYSTGMRRNELVRLAVRDVDFLRGVVAIRHGKGRRDRVVPIGERALAWLRRYLEDVRPHLMTPPPHDLIFVNYTGRVLSRNGLSDLVSKIIIRADIGKEGSCHLFRHTAATLMLENGADIRFIQEMLGHVKLDTTQVYTRVSIGKLKAIHDATHPAAKLRSGRRRERPATQQTNPRIILDGGVEDPLVN